MALADLDETYIHLVSNRFLKARELQCLLNASNEKTEISKVTINTILDKGNIFFILNKSFVLSSFIIISRKFNSNHIPSYFINSNLNTFPVLHPFTFNAKYN